MALLSTQTLSKTSGTTLSFASAAGGGDEVAWGPRTFLYVKNGDASGITVTVAVPGNTGYGVAKPDPTFTVNATSELCIPINDAEYEASDGNIDISYSAVTSVTVAAVSV